MKEAIRIEIGENEWKNFPKDKRERMKKILQEEYGYDIEKIIQIETEEDK